MKARHNFLMKEKLFKQKSRPQKFLTSHLKRKEEKKDKFSKSL